MAPALLLGLLFFGCSRKEEAKQAEAPPPAAPEVKILATVNGDPITMGEFLERFSRAQKHIIDVNNPITKPP